MMRCEYDDDRDRSWEKTRECTLSQFAARSGARADAVPAEVMAALSRVSQPEDLRELVDTQRPHMTRLQFLRLVEAIERLYGTAFTRCSGLPVDRPRLSVAS